MSSLLVKGFVLGFAIAAAPGPIFFLCLKRTLLRGRLLGVISGLGVATADGFYAALAAFGVAALTSAFISGRSALALAGGVVLVVLGARIVVEGRTPPEKEAPATASGLAWAYASTLGLTITNPATIISFAALAATLGLGAGGGFARPATLVAGVVAGSAAWWCSLALMVSMLRARVTPGVVRGISTASGLVIVVLGMLAIVSAFQVGT